jgi:hypothetical protein
MLIGPYGGQLVSAFGLAGSQVAGMLEFYGESMQKSASNPVPPPTTPFWQLKLAQRASPAPTRFCEANAAYDRAYCDNTD